MILHSLLLGASLTLGAITPAKVDNVVANSPAPQTPPQIIYVDLFSMSGALNQGGEWR